MDNEKIIVSLNDETKEIYPLVNIKYNNFEYVFYIISPNDFESVFVGKIINENICPVEEKEYQELFKIIMKLIDYLKGNK